jgi:hypothetical protein
MAHGDDQGVVARSRMNDRGDALMGVGVVESGAYISPNKLMRMTLTNPLSDEMRLHLRKEPQCLMRCHIQCVEVRRDALAVSRRANLTRTEVQRGPTP